MFVLFYCLTIESDGICQLRHFVLIRDWYAVYAVSCIQAILRKAEIESEYVLFIYLFICIFWSI